MSENLKGILELEMKTDRFVSGGQKAREEITKVNEETKKASISIGAGTQKVLAFGAAMGSTVFAAKGLVDMQLQLRKAAFQRGEAEDAVNKLLREGKKDTDEYTDAVEKLNIKQEVYNQTLDNIQQAHIQFGFSLATLAATTLPNLIKSLTGTVAGHAAAGGAALGHAAAETAVTVSLRAQLLVMLHHPWFLPAVLAASAIGIGILATNTFGLRDALFGATEAMEKNTNAVSKSSQAYGNASTSVIAYSGAIAQATEELKTFNGFVAVTNEQAGKIFEMLQKEGPGTGGLIKYYETIENLQNEINSDLQLGLKYNVNQSLLVRTLVDDYAEQAKAAGLTTKELAFQIQHQLRLIDLEERKEAAKERARQNDRESKKNEVRTIGEIAAAYQIAAKEARNVRRELKDATGEIVYQNDVELTNLKALLQIRDEAQGQGDFAGAQLAQDLINEKYGGRNVFGTSDILTLEKFGVTSFGQSEMSLMGLPTDRTINIAQDKHAKSVAAANKAFAAAGQKSLSKKQASKRRGGHSRFRRDTESGRWRSFLEFTLPKILGNAMKTSGLDEETLYALARKAMSTKSTVRSGFLRDDGTVVHSAGESSFYQRHEFDRALFERLVAEEAERQAEAPFLSFGGSKFVEETLGFTRLEATAILSNELTENDIAGMLAFAAREGMSGPIQSFSSRPISTPTPIDRTRARRNHLVSNLASELGLNQRKLLVSTGV